MVISTVCNAEIESVGFPRYTNEGVEVAAEDVKKMSNKAIFEKIRAGYKLYETALSSYSSEVEAKAANVIMEKVVADVKPLVDELYSRNGNVKELEDIAKYVYRDEKSFQKKLAKLKKGDIELKEQHFKFVAGSSEEGTILFFYAMNWLRSSYGEDNLAKLFKALEKE